MLYPDPILRTKNAPVTVFDDRLKELVAEMFDIMYKYGTSHLHVSVLQHSSSLSCGLTEGIYSSLILPLKTRVVSRINLLICRTDGCGLSAPQVGVNVNLMVYNPAGVPGRGEEHVLVNPVIAKRSKKTEVDEEGCLSFPNIYADVEVHFAVHRLSQNLIFVSGHMCD